MTTPEVKTENKYHGLNKTELRYIDAFNEEIEAVTFTN